MKGVAFPAGLLGVFHGEIHHRTAQHRIYENGSRLLLFSESLRGMTRTVTSSVPSVRVTS